MQPAIRVENLSKLFHLGAGRKEAYLTLRETMVRGMSAPWHAVRNALARRAMNRGGQGESSAPDSIWALKDVSFNVQPGEVLGVIGRNGAGKSTLLKIVSHITEPSNGRVRLRGRVGSLLEVGTGFHPELTGSENIYLNGAILGMSHREIRRKFDAIVAFAEIERFLDTPVKRYSSGMYMRLAFAVASHLEPDILLVDEVLAVGDHTFQKKCLGRMGEIGRSGRTVLFVSHNMAIIMSLCEKILVLDKGSCVFVGECKKGVELYTSQSRSPTGGELDLVGHPNRSSASAPILRKIRLLDRSGSATDQFLCGEPIVMELAVAPSAGHSDLHFGIWIEDSFGRRLFTVATYMSDWALRPVTRPKHVRCHLDQLPLAPGRYRLSLHAGPLDNVEVDVIDQAIWFEVNPSDFYRNGRLPRPVRGPFLVRSKWTDEELHASC